MEVYNRWIQSVFLQQNSYKSGEKEPGQGIGRVDALFHQMFPSTSSNEHDEHDDDVIKSAEAYHNYKKEYLKHLSFTPEGENLSKFYI